ncbi:hypothetical protein HDA41_004836 [Streptomyces caelestis]|uniref:Uncharacterized protein n=1 Tax=Streptomyces caelestis TaxID=36816 RepID=A0A7W9LUY6_9ACTN|nr:hypothetical protein [Streptomyces caelestis]
MASRRAAVHWEAPESQASGSGTLWSTSMAAAEVILRAS